MHRKSRKMSVFTDWPRTILGPLTTTFVPPPFCSIAVAQCQTCGLAWQAQTCDPSNGIQDATDCWPPRTTGAPTANSPPLNGWGFYSPGLACPTGYQTACTAEYASNSQWPVQFQLVPGETAVGCCPTGYACTNLNGQTCVATATSTTFPTVTCESGTSGAFGFEQIPATITVTPTRSSAGGDAVLPTATVISEYFIFAPMIQLNFQSTDCSAAPGCSTSASLTTQTITLPSNLMSDDTILLTATATLSSSSSSSRAEHSTTPSPASGSASPSTAAAAAAGSQESGGGGDATMFVKAAVGVGSGVSVLGLIFLGLILFRLRERKQHRLARERRRQRLGLGVLPPPPPPKTLHPAVAELYGWDKGPHEMAVPIPKGWWGQEVTAAAGPGGGHRPLTQNWPLKP